MADVKKAWDNLLDVLGSRWNLMGLDLKNEPHGKATWGFGDKKTDWCVCCLVDGWRLSRMCAYVDETRRPTRLVIDRY